MAGFRAAKRYAKGLILFANETKQAEQIFAEMKDLKKGIQDSRELTNFLASPVLDAKKKNKIGAELFKDFSPLSQNFIKLVINHSRGDILSEIASQYISQFNHQNNISTAEVISAVELDDAMVQQIVDAMKKNFGSDTNFSIENKVNPEILGGFVLRVGDKQIDSSVQSRLNRLKKEFDKNEYIPKF